MFSGVGSEWEAVAAKSVKCRSSNMDDRGIIPLNGRRTMAESMTEVREQGSKQTKGRTSEHRTQHPKPRLKLKPNQNQLASDLCSCPTMGICKYGKETQDPTGRNVAIFDFRFRVNIFLGQRDRETRSNLLANYNRSAHIYTRSYPCLHAQFG